MFGAYYGAVRELDGVNAVFVRKLCVVSHRPVLFSFFFSFLFPILGVGWRKLVMVLGLPWPGLFRSLGDGREGKGRKVGHDLFGNRLVRVRCVRLSLTLALTLKQHQRNANSNAT